MGLIFNLPSSNILDGELRYTCLSQLVSSIRYKLPYVYTAKIQNQSGHSDQSLSFLPEEMVDPWLPIED